MIYVPIVIVILISIILGGNAITTYQKKLTITPSPKVNISLPPKKLTPTNTVTINPKTKTVPTNTPYIQNIQPTEPQQAQEFINVASPTTATTNNNYQMPLNIQAPTITIAPVVIEVDCSGVQNTIAELKNMWQSSIDRETRRINEEMGKRGILPSSGFYQSEMARGLEPIYSQRNFQISDFCIQMSTINSCPCP